MKKIHLGVNIDHIATLRQARGGVEPEPLTGAVLAELGGADSITIHLREDRRHIQDRDLKLLKKTVNTKLNLEMALNDEIIGIALDVEPDQVTFVPEKRQEITTEGGLDIERNFKKLQKIVPLFNKKNIIVSFFIDPDEKQINLSKDAGAEYIEAHTGQYANAKKQNAIQNELIKIYKAAELSDKINLGFNAGHGLNYINVIDILKIKNLYELNIGHSIVSRAVFVGLKKAVYEMVQIIRSYS